MGLPPARGPGSRLDEVPCTTARGRGCTGPPHVQARGRGWTKSPAPPLGVAAGRVPVTCTPGPGVAAGRGRGYPKPGVAAGRRPIHPKPGVAAGRRTAAAPGRLRRVGTCVPFRDLPVSAIACHSLQPSSSRPRRLRWRSVGCSPRLKAHSHMTEKPDRWSHAPVRPPGESMAARLRSLPGSGDHHPRTRSASAFAPDCGRRAETAR